MEGINILLRSVTYTSEIHTASMRDRTVTIENKTPQLSEQERAEQYRAIECGLFDIFIKYEDSYLRAAGVWCTCQQLFFYPLNDIERE